MYCFLNWLLRRHLIINIGLHVHYLLGWHFAFKARWPAFWKLPCCPLLFFYLKWLALPWSPDRTKSVWVVRKFVLMSSHWSLMPIFHLWKSVMVAVAWFVSIPKWNAPVTLNAGNLTWIDPFFWRCLFILGVKIGKKKASVFTTATTCPSDSARYSKMCWMKWAIQPTICSLQQAQLALLELHIAYYLSYLLSSQNQIWLQSKSWIWSSDKTKIQKNPCF